MDGQRRTAVKPLSEQVSAGTRSKAKERVGEGKVSLGGLDRLEPASREKWEEAVKR